VTGLSVKNISKIFRVELPREDTFSALTRFFSGRSPSADFLALDSVSLDLKPGSALAICGPNGSGKTTLLKILAGITLPSSGSVSGGGKRACLLGFSSILQERLSVKENAALCAVFFELPGRTADNAEKIMSSSDLGHLRNARAGELSAGMKLRLPFMAALASGADLFLIDETLAVGDAGFKARCLKELRALQARGAILVFATHDAELARTLAGEALVLENGRVIFHGAPDKMPKPGGAGMMGADFGRGLERIPLLYSLLKEAGFGFSGFPPASDEDLLLVHSRSWLARLKANDLNPEEEKELALPHSKLILPYSWLLAGGAIAAARGALERGLGIFPRGGGHHAFPERGEGLYPVNDIAVAARVLLKEKLVKRPAVIDLDAHQGNGTAFIFSGGEVKTFSVHRADGHPRNRVRSSMDAEIPAGARDRVYLEAVKKGVKDFLKMAKPDLVFALCSADAFEKDSFGGLRISMEGLKKRDTLLFKTLAGLGIPACLVLGGSYSSPEEAARINLNTIKAAAEAYPAFDKTVLESIR